MEEQIELTIFIEDSVVCQTRCTANFSEILHDVSLKQQPTSRPALESIIYKISTNQAPTPTPMLMQGMCTIPILVAKEATGYPSKAEHLVNM